MIKAADFLHQAHDIAPALDRAIACMGETNLPFAFIIATTGKTGRELFTLAHRCDDIPGLAHVLNCAFTQPGPHLIHMRTSPGSMASLTRPNITPAKVARRLKNFIATKTTVY